MNIITLVLPVTIQHIPIRKCMKWNIYKTWDKCMALKYTNTCTNTDLAY